MFSQDKFREVYKLDSQKAVEAKIKELSKRMKFFTRVTVNDFTITAYLAPEFI